MFDLSLNFKFGFLVRRCCAHLAGAISLKNGGRNGLLYLRKSKLKLTIMFLTFVSFMPYISLNSLGRVLNAVKDINGQMGLICLGTGPPPIMSYTSFATSVKTR